MSLTADLEFKYRAQVGLALLSLTVRSCLGIWKSTGMGRGGVGGGARGCIHMLHDMHKRNSEVAVSVSGGYVHGTGRFGLLPDSVGL